MKLNLELTQRILDLYNNGAISMQAVGQQVGLTDSAVWYHLRKGGAKMRKQGQCVTTRLGISDPALAAREHPTTIDIAWAAGLYEGEGSCLIRKDRPDTNIVIVQKDRWICDRLRALFGGSVTAHQQLTTHHKEPITMYYWRATGARGRGFAMTIYKFLSPRRKDRIREALAQ